MENLNNLFVEKGSENILSLFCFPYCGMLILVTQEQTDNRMTNDQQFTLTISIFSLVFTFTGVLAAIIFNGFKKTQDSHADELANHGKELVKLKEQQYLKIEKLEEHVYELKEEVHELRKELKQQISTENEALRNVLNAMQRVEQSLRQTT